MQFLIRMTQTFLLHVSCFANILFFFLAGYNLFKASDQQI